MVTAGRGETAAELTLEGMAFSLCIAAARVRKSSWVLSRMYLYAFRSSSLSVHVETCVEVSEFHQKPELPTFSFKLTGDGLADPRVAQSGPSR